MGGRVVGVVVEGVDVALVDIVVVVAEVTDVEVAQTDFDLRCDPLVYIHFDMFQLHEPLSMSMAASHSAQEK